MNFAELIKQSVKMAISEDLQNQPDITALLIPENTTSTAKIITREEMIVCGKDWVNEVYAQLDQNININWFFSDGDVVPANSIIFNLSGNARSLLTGERTALNFLQMLSGIATTTNKYVQKLQGTKTKLLDTRKTIPGLRYAQKYAVKCGGGKNHRMGLYAAFLIKENHIIACGSIKNAIQNARVIAPDKTVEIEVESLEDLQQALDAKAEIILLDNFTIDAMRSAVEINQGRAKLEVSGNVDLHTIRDIAKTGVDYISVGALTKNITAIDLSMRLELP